MYQKYKKIIWGVVIVLALFVLYSIFFKKSPEPALTQASAAGTTAADEELIALLNQVKGIDLNSAIFSNELFLSLTNYSVELVPEPNVFFSKRTMSMPRSAASRAIPAPAMPPPTTASE
jgi:hypothetical protein